MKVTKMWLLQFLQIWTEDRLWVVLKDSVIRVRRFSIVCDSLCQNPHFYKFTRFFAIQKSGHIIKVMWHLHGRHILVFVTIWWTRTHLRSKINLYYCICNYDYFAYQLCLKIYPKIKTILKIAYENRKENRICSFKILSFDWTSFSLV